MLNQQMQNHPHERVPPSQGSGERTADDQSAGALLLIVYEQHGQALYGYIRRMLDSAPDAEDVVQESFARALLWNQGAALPNDDEGRLRCRRWLFQVATNLSLDLLRKRKRGSLRFWQALGQRQAEARDENQENHAAPAQLADPAPQLQEAMIQRALIESALGVLKPTDRSLLLLHEHYGFSLGELATMAQCSYAAAAKKVARARQQFIQQYRALNREEEA